MHYGAQNAVTQSLIHPFNIHLVTPAVVHLSRRHHPPYTLHHTPYSRMCVSTTPFPPFSSSLCVFRERGIYWRTRSLMTTWGCTRVCTSPEDAMRMWSSNFFDARFLVRWRGEGGNVFHLLSLYPHPLSLLFSDSPPPFAPSLACQE